MKDNCEKYKFLKDLQYIIDLNTDFDDQEDFEELMIYEGILNKLIKKNKWKTIFQYFNIFKYEITLKQTKKDCINFLKAKNEYDYYQLQFIIKQDDELVLLALKDNLYALKYIRIVLKKETLVEIDLLYGERIEKNIELKFYYNLLLEEII